MNNALMVIEQRGHERFGRMERKEVVHMAEPILHGIEDVEKMTEKNTMRRRVKDAEHATLRAMRSAAAERRRFQALVKVLAGSAVIGCVICTTVFGICGMPWWACVLPTVCAAGIAKAVGWL